MNNNNDVEVPQNLEALESDDGDTLSFLMEPSTIGEALEDYFKKLEIISPDRSIISLHMPLGTDEDGNVPVIATLQPILEARAN